MITVQDIPVIVVLVFLEGILSIDNALVLSLLARKLPSNSQQKALTYGLVGSVVFRLIAIGLAIYLMHWHWIKFVGGAYLLSLAAQHFFPKRKKTKASIRSKSYTFWKTVAVIEIMDIAFASDSILAAVALTPKFWVVFIGGFIGVVVMRLAAIILIRVLGRFPYFETSAYFLITVIGVKVVIEGFALPSVDFQSYTNPAFWIFWVLVFECFLYGFVSKGVSLREQQRRVMLRRKKKINEFLAKTFFGKDKEQKK